jgi:uncharacterized membrane protein YdjX (TVP38/TMEM64 family)
LTFEKLLPVLWTGLAAVVLLVAWSAHDTGPLASIEELRRHFAGVDTWGGLFSFALLYVAAIHLFVPVTPLMVIGALTFGPFWGFAAVEGASILAAAVGFLFARSVGRGAFQRLVSSRPSSLRLLGCFQESGWMAAGFARMVPVLPSAVVNYAFGATQVPFGRYLLASALGMIPYNGSVVLCADTVHRSLAQGENAWFGLLWTGPLLLVFLGVGWLLRRGCEGKSLGIARAEPRS